MLKLHPADAFVLFISLFALVLSIKVASVESGVPIVKIDSVDGAFIYQLDMNREVSVSGPQGLCRVRIQDGTVNVVDSDCPDKLCQTLGPLNESGDWTACLPNSVMIWLEADPLAGQSGLDGVAY